MDAKARELLETLKAAGITKVKVGGFDIDGVLRGKYMSLDKFQSALKGGFGFCDVIFGWDLHDVLYDNAKVTGWDSGYPDTHAVLDLDTFRVLPDEPGTAAMLVDFVTATGEAHPACPRGLLKKVLARAKAMGFRATFASELEFYVFKETPESIRDKGYRGLTPLSPGMFGYSWLRTGENKAFCEALWEGALAFDIPLEALHTETGPGVYEVAIRYDEALRMADKAALFKTLAKEIGFRHGAMPTFMAKWNPNLPGSSGHLHQSLWGKAPGSDEEVNLFYQEGAPAELSALGGSYLAGQLALMPELTALLSPTVNSYKRYVPGVWAPLTATWGVENRTCALRAIAGGPSGTRLEHRQPAADLNPYIALATALAAGLWGIEQKLTPPPPSRGDASATTDPKLTLPRTLREANARLADSEVARTLLGEGFVQHYVATRDWEARQYERAVTDWELARYFEAI
ncbi:MAG TPA: glutamine synthetase family protein [Polyangiaceae bacterium]|nr:glutamine synthetase family protein [Polyangiaceae bacterium]